MANFTKFGNDLYTGARSFDIVGRRRLWYLVSGIVILLCVLGPLLRGGFAFGIEFRGGSEFQVPGVDVSDSIEAQNIALDAVEGIADDAAPRASVLGGDTVRVQTEQLPEGESREIRESLADAFGVPIEDVTASFIGPAWGADITNQALRALVIFLVVVSLIMALYFRTWKMSLAAIIAMLHDLVVTAGVYGIFGFEVTPAAVIGLLTILGYSLYDTVVVFDKIRENTSEEGEQSRRTFAQSVNLAVNQTIVRSINTSVVATLPIAAILFIGALLLGAGTLRDIALALFIGTIVSTYSTIFVAAPVYTHLRENEPEVKKLGSKREPVKAASPSGAVR
ncbi:MAG: protein translocase subunit SecF [Actinomycetota bacterium]|nr:protein translocase subunit SecF [Actinomycetota bacterium]